MRTYFLIFSRPVFGTSFAHVERTPASMYVIVRGRHWLNGDGQSTISQGVKTIATGLILMGAVGLPLLQFTKSCNVKVGDNSMYE